MNGDPKAYTFAKKSQSNVGHLNMTVELTRYNGNETITNGSKHHYIVVRNISTLMEAEFLK